MTSIAELILLVVVALGVLGTILPALPGAALIVIAAFVYAWVTHFAVLGSTDLVLLSILAVLSYVSDFALGLGGARHFGARRPGTIGAMIGLLGGVFVLGPIGILVGPIAGAAIGELLYGRQWKEAFRAGLGAGVGTLVASAVRLGIGLIMFLYILWQVVWGR